MTNSNWHTDYLNKVKNMSGFQLHYVINDCKEVLQANPDTPKSNQYMDEILYCQAEIKRRIDGGR
tara:strand:+ start:758 stop:952 length:195 start_codon:yes stop_codon:yes gene_type:complete